MLTGDNPQTAKAVAEEMNLSSYKAECLPQDKLEEIERLQDEGKKVAMAGDGTNDAPALAQSDIGIAMGTGTDVAMESAMITLVKGDLNGIVKAKNLSTEVVKNIKQNLFFAMIYNSVGVPIAAGVLFPVFGILLSPMIAALAMSFSSVSVIGNALRLRGVKSLDSVPRYRAYIASGTEIRINRRTIMPFKKGEVYQCPDSGCGCEVTVTKSAPPSCGGTQNPTCCCGKQ